MKRTSTTRKTLSEISPAFLLSARVLIMMTALLIVIMPWTEYFWHFDQFVLGGQDFELGLLAIATILGLILVLLQHSRAGVSFIFALQQGLYLAFERLTLSVPSSFYGLIAALHVGPIPSPALQFYNLPLQV